MREAGWSARRVARQLGRSDCVEVVLGQVDPRNVIYTKTRLKRRYRQTSRREGHHIVRNGRVHPTASSAAIQAQVAPYLGANVSSQTILRRLAERLGIAAPITCAALDAHSLTHGATHEEIGLQWNGTRSSLATNPNSISAVVTIVFVCGDPVVNTSLLPLLYSDTPLPQLV
ncbi:uncharacterized protein TNCV_4780641 [Trichonephila clavipes]|nr:uncharacterized protein TNCV_4780641 [Trichonephila clavipes]